MQLNELLNQIKTSPQVVQFKDVISVIDQSYHFTPTHFINGDTVNEVNQNNGSCKIFAFAKLNHLDVTQTLNCFGDYYRVDVLENPEGKDHANIRNFIKYQWEGVKFSQAALEPKSN